MYPAGYGMRDGLLRCRPVNEPRKYQRCTNVFNLCRYLRSVRGRMQSTQQSSLPGMCGGLQTMRCRLQKNAYILMDQLIQIKHFASEAHGDQRRKFADEPYINHPVRVMELCREYTSALPVLYAALLHDVLEDTAVTAKELSVFLHSILSPEDAARTLTLTIELTDVYVKKNFPTLNRRARKQKEATRLGNVSPEGQIIKYADIIDNANDIAKAEDDFVPTFLHECRQLLKVMTNGDPVLRQRARELVEQQLAAATGKP